MQVSLQSNFFSALPSLTLPDGYAQRSIADPELIENAESNAIKPYLAASAVNAVGEYVKKGRGRKALQVLKVSRQTIPQQLRTRRE